jgi:mono/diheme cytochrome c family protein
MKIRIGKFVPICGALSMLGLGWGALGQTVAHSAQDGIYTQAQAARGKALYLDNCAACHGVQLLGGEDSPPLAGAPFISKWGKLPLSALYGLTNTTMPLGAAGSLGAAGNADIVAYILAYNGFPAGQNELPPDAKVLADITIEAKP